MANHTINMVICPGLAEYGAEHWLGEAMIPAIWEGTPHRQILDGLEEMNASRRTKAIK